MAGNVFFDALKKNFDQKVKKMVKEEKEKIKGELSVFQEKKVIFDETFPLNQRIERTKEKGRVVDKHYELREGFDLEEIKKDPNWLNNMDYWQEVDVN